MTELSAVAVGISVSILVSSINSAAAGTLPVNMVQVVIP
jgi:hypothetical protein